MTLLDYLYNKYPEMKKRKVSGLPCPSSFGLDDPRGYDCGGLTCEECWNRTYEGDEFGATIKVMLDPGAKMPVRAHPTDAGMDLFAMEGGRISPCGSAIFDTGVHVDIPVGYVGLLTSKSGLMAKQEITSRGTIDSGYRGSIKAVLFNHSHVYVNIEKGQKITQLVILPIITPAVKLVDSLEDTDRGTGGFGSSGAF